MNTQPTQIQTSQLLKTKLFITALAALALVGAGRYEWDEQIARNPQCTDAAPSIFLRSETLAKIALQCVGDINLDAANRNALASLRRQGHNQLAMVVMGSIFDLKSNQREADKWMHAASSLGRRDYAVESYWADRSIQDNNLVFAAQSVDALFRSGWTSAALMDQVRALEATNSGREALLSIVSRNSQWMKNYLIDVQTLSNSQLANRRTLLLEAARRTRHKSSLSSLATDIILPAVSESYKRQYINAAYQLRRTYKPFDLSALVNDGSFGETERLLRSPFDWSFSHASGLDVSIVARSGGHALGLRGDGSGRFNIANQTVKLAPGTYSVTISGARHNYANSASNLVVILAPETTSNAASQIITMTFPDLGRPSTAQFTIQDPALFYRLDLALDVVNTSTSLDLEIESVNIEQLH